MKVLINIAAIYLSVIFISCSDELDRGGSSGGSVFVAGVATKVALNPTEQRLRGEWFLRSMSTRDTLYSDSIENNKLTISFSEFASPGETLPMFDENFGLYAKATPDSVRAGVYETYRADSAELIIYFKAIYQAPFYTVFQITRLDPYNLDLSDPVTGKGWKFKR